MAEAEMVSHLVLQQPAVPEEGVRSGRGGGEDEILSFVGKKYRRKGQQHVVVLRETAPYRLGQCRWYVELEDRHFVIPRAGEVLKQMRGEVRHYVAIGESAVSIAVTRIAQKREPDR